MEFNSPIGGTGQSKYKETKWHGAVSRLQDGTMGQLELQTVRRHPEHVTPAEGRPDGSEEKANEQRLGRRRGRVHHTALQPKDRGSGKLSRRSDGEVATAKARTTESCRRDCKAGKPAVLATHARALSGPVAKPCLLTPVASQSGRAPGGGS